MVSVRIGEALQNGRCSFDVSKDFWFGNREMSLASRCVWPGKQDETVDTEFLILVESRRVECLDGCHGHLEGAEFCWTIPALLFFGDHLHRLGSMFEIGIEQIPAVGSRDSAAPRGFLDSAQDDRWSTSLYRPGVGVNPRKRHGLT
jgi:hypothetical protein